jgi:hypothetical protein
MNTTPFERGIYLDGVAYELPANTPASLCGGELIQLISTNNGCLYIGGELVQPDVRYEIPNNSYIRTRDISAPNVGVNPPELSLDAKITLAALRRCRHEPSSPHQLELETPYRGAEELRTGGYLVGDMLTPRAFHLTSSKVFKAKRYEDQDHA